MTADFLTDLDVIGHLDWTPGCYVNGCNEPTAWYVRQRTLCCQGSGDGILCVQHKEDLLANVDGINEAPVARCRDCGAVTLAAPRLTIDRIVPLNA